jgi:hypothetical protein
MLYKAPIILLTMVLCYLFGGYSYSHRIWPIDWLRTLNLHLHTLTYNNLSPIKKITASIDASQSENFLDEYDRLIFNPNKVEVPCPIQTKDTAVLLAFGQSNIANASPALTTTEFPSQVFNFFNGKCFIAGSPLLGAAGNGGEFLTPLADNLIKSKKYKLVIISSSGIGATNISRWQKYGDLNEMLLSVVDSIQKNFVITDILWHQGENDFIHKTSAKVYANSFLSILESLKERGVNAPAHISISTKCNQLNWYPKNPTSEGQKFLLAQNGIHLGANTDLILDDMDRAVDRCHFSATGIKKTAKSYADSIINNR